MQNILEVVNKLYYDCLQQGVSTATINENSTVMVRNNQGTCSPGRSIEKEAHDCRIILPLSRGLSVSFPI